MKVPVSFTLDIDSEDARQVFGLDNATDAELKELVRQSMFEQAVALAIKLGYMHTEFHASVRHDKRKVRLSE